MKIDKYLRLAIRNVLKNGKRSILTIGAVAAGICAVILAQGFINYSLWGLRESIINGGTGHFQIYKEGYSENGIDEPFSYLIENYKKLIINELAEIPGIEVYTPRLGFSGLAVKGDRTVRIEGYGGVADEEKKVTAFSTMVEGESLDTLNSQGIVIGAGVAKKLSAKNGDILTLQIPTDGGGYNAVNAEVKGILEGQIEYVNNVFLLADIGFVQNIMNVPKKADRIVLKLVSTDNMAQVEEKLKEICKRNKLEYKTWRELAGIEYEQPRLFYMTVFYILITIVAIVSLFSVINTVRINVYERIREIGTLRVLGMTKNEIIALFSLEGLIFGIAGGVAGIAAALAISAVVNGTGGLYIPPPPGNARGYTAFFQIDMIRGMGYLGIFTVVSIVGAVFPALKISKTVICEALRGIK